MRMKTYLALLPLICLIGLQSAAAQTPTNMLRKTHARINKLLKKKVAKGSADDARIKTAITKEVNAFLDFAELARLSLGKHWAKRTEAEQQEFTQILKDLIERNYVKQLRSNLGYKLEYRTEKISGDAALVSTAVKVKKKNRTSEILIDYKLRKTSGKWMAFDVITDEVSVVKNYRSQFNRIIRKNSYEHLVKKMRSKLEDKS